MLASLSTRRRASILLESSRIPINSRHVHAGKVFPGAMGIFRSVKRCKIWHRAVMHFDLGGEVAKKKSSSIWITLGIFKFSLNDPFNCRRKFVKKEGGPPETEGEDHIEEIEPFPFHTQKFPIRGVDGNIAKC